MARTRLRHHVARKPKLDACQTHRPTIHGDLRSFTGLRRSGGGRSRNVELDESPSCGDPPLVRVLPGGVEQCDALAVPQKPRAR
jgi:hypothetical protein